MYFNFFGSDKYILETYVAISFGTSGGEQTYTHTILWWNNTLEYKDQTS
jgi:hypothetical protein